MSYFLFARQHTTRNTGGVMKTQATHNGRGESAAQFMSTTHTLTELDAAIIAEEQGWEYLPACDEAELLIAEAEEIKVAATTQPQTKAIQSKPKYTRRWLRTEAIRWAMPLIKDGGDWQQVQHELVNHDLFSQLSEGMTNDAAADYYMGIIRFCEHALGYNQ
jgi:hypothetical protein